MPRGRANVFLIGFMGCGKSAVGRALARRLALRFTDTDREIERAQGLSVRRIFAERGEGAFRRLEARAVARAARLGGIVAVGGGAATKKENVSAMRARGTVVYLSASFPVLSARVKKNGASARPLWARARSLLARRRPLYRRAAHCTVRAGSGSPDEIAARIARKLE